VDSALAPFPGSVFCQTSVVSASLDISTLFGIRIFKLTLLFLAFLFLVSVLSKKYAKTSFFFFFFLIVCFAAGGGTVFLISSSKLFSKASL